VSNYRTSNDQRIGKNMEGNGCGLMAGLTERV
jgi:hypothetical protein